MKRTLRDMPPTYSPMRAEDFERDRAVVNTLAAEADADGIVVYGSPKGACMKAPDPRARRQAVERWLRVAERDRQAVLACMAADLPLRDSAAFYCQQAVEKLFKGFLTLAGKRGRKNGANGRRSTAVRRRTHLPSPRRRSCTPRAWSSTRWRPGCAANPEPPGS